MSALSKRIGFLRVRFHGINEKKISAYGLES